MFVGMKVINGNGVKKSVDEIIQTEVFHSNFNSHMKSLQTQLQTATEPLKTILMMQLENGYKAFIL